LMFPPAPSVAPHIESGRLRALAVTSARQSALAPGLPTIASSVPGYEAGAITGIWAPANTPQAIISLLNREIVRFLMRPEIREKFLNAGVDVVGSSPAEFAVVMKADLLKWSKVVRDAGISVN
jgi:tripartite-type tricarboxylate transporter receptor subunit TctC